MFHLPLYNYAEANEFRKHTNESLQQYGYCQIPIIPQWKRLIFSPTEFSKPQGVVMTYERQASFGPILITVMPNGKAAMCYLPSGLWYFIGTCQKSVEGTLVFLADYAKSFFDSAFGGHFTVIDTLVYDNLNTVDFEWKERHDITKCINDFIVFPDRFKISSAVLPQNASQDKFNIYVLN